MAEDDLSKLSREELLEEIRLEEDHLRELRTALVEAETRRDELRKTIEEEQLPRFEERVRRRQARIEELERSLPEYDVQIARFEGRADDIEKRIAEREARIDDREKRIAELEESIAFQERIAATALSLITREIARRVAEILSRSVSRLRGWQTRDRRALTALRGWRTRYQRLLGEVRGLKAWARRRIAALRGWQVREEPQVSRLEILRKTLAELEVNIAGLNETIELEEIRLAKKKELLPPLEIIQSKIVIFSTSESLDPSRPYTRRFQIFYNVDAPRDTTTGDIDYEYPLTADELDACTEDFYARWNWIDDAGNPKLPPRTTEPDWAEAGEYEPTEKPLGATCKELSVIEEEEETYYQRITPPELVYRVTREEAEDMLRHIGLKDDEIKEILGE